MEALLPEGVAVVRAMPNTPALIGRGVTGLAGGSTASAEHLELARGLFETVGAVLVVDEGLIDAVTAVSGSGPAYLFLYAEEMTAAARRLGFDDEQAALLVQGTIAGAAELMIRSGDDPAQLRRDVTSPKGTTEQAVEVLQAADWGGLFDRALAANIRRSEELRA
jgi:pyrroline-5-carboxylate reductase